MPDANIIPFELPLPQTLPTIEGNVDYRDFRGQFLRINGLLAQSELETQMLEADLQRWRAGQKCVSAKAQQSHQLHAQRALRCNIARILIQEDYRGFAARLADSPLLQCFCGISEVDRVVVPSKSTLQRYFSCLCANIHYPADWVLLRDATRTLMASVRLIRDQGLKHRMEAPETFLSRINGLCLKMTHAWNRQEAQVSRRLRKQTLRQMDRLVGTVRHHARRYRQLLDEHWERTDWTRPQAEQVLGRMDEVLEQLPKARQQARQRILKGQLVPNQEKILSLYETDVHVIVRKQAGAEVEFGHTLFLAENPQGLIIDWEFFRESAPADATLLPRSVARMQEAYAPGPQALGGDRGFDSQLNRFGLNEEKIFNAVCPRSPGQLQQRNRSWKFKRMQRRRAQTEGRIGMVKNVFLGGRMRCKGFAHRDLTVTWTVLVHNLWVLARLPQAQAAQAQRRAA